MHAARRLGSGTVAGAAFTIMLAQMFHPVILASLHYGQTAAWLVILLAGVWAALTYAGVAYGTRDLAHGGLISLAMRAAGKPGAIITACLLTVFVLFHVGLVMRETSEMAVAAIYPHTPQTFATVGLVICALFGAWGGLPSIARLLRGFTPVLLVGTLAVVVGPIAWGNIRYLQPFWGPGPLPLLGRSALLTGKFAPMVLFLLYAGGHVAKEDRRWWKGSVVIALAAMVTSIIKVVLIKAYPLPLGSFVTFPLHELSRLITGGRFFERVEGFWVLYWVFGTACHISALLHCAAAAYAEAFDMGSHRLTLLPLVLGATTIAFFPPDQKQAITMHFGGIPLGLVIVFGLPVGLLLVAALRRKLGTHAA